MGTVKHAQFTLATPQHRLCFLPERQGHISFRPIFLSSMRFPPPIHRPAIPFAIRQQNKVQQHVDELRSGIPILRQASPDL